jgi:hypothetical protein
MRILNLNGIGALPVGFKGKINGKSFSIRVQYDAFGGVKAQIFDESGTGGIITSIMGAKGETESKGADFGQWALAGTELSSKVGKYYDKEKDDIRKRAKAFVKQLSGEVSDYNKGKDTRIKKVKTVVIAPAPKITVKKEIVKIAPKPVAKNKVTSSEKKNIDLDKKRSALPPGKRPAGPDAKRKFYFESRRNRSDKPGTKL